MEKHTVDPKVYFEWIKHKPTIHSAIVLLNGNDETLMLKRSFGANKGKWEFPSGGIEKDEMPEMAAFRELEEETGIKIEIPLIGIGVFRAVNEDKTDFILSYLGRITGSKPIKLSWEHDEYKWVCLEDAKLMPMHPTVREMLMKAYSVENK